MLVKALRPVSRTLCNNSEYAEGARAMAGVRMATDIRRGGFGIK